MSTSQQTGALDRAKGWVRAHRVGLAYALVGVACLLTLVVSMSVWVNRQLLDTDVWVDQSARMLQNEDVRHALALRLVDAAYSQGDVENRLEQVLASARTLSDGGRVLVVFGCGGERDVTKRPVMGEVASRLADRVYLTSDNPRGEDPQEIIDDVKAGMLVTDALVVDADRRSAIAAAVADAAPGDVVVIAGKGHETTQTIGGVARPFDDRQVAAEVLDERERSRS